MLKTFPIILTLPSVITTVTYDSIITKIILSSDFGFGDDCAFEAVKIKYARLVSNGRLLVVGNPAQKKETLQPQQWRQTHPLNRLCVGF